MTASCPYSFCDGSGTYVDRVDHRTHACVCVLDAEAADQRADHLGDSQRFDAADGA